MIQIQQGFIHEGERVLIVDDLLATGGTAMAAVSLVKKVGGIVEEVTCQIELVDLRGKQKLEAIGIPFFGLFQF